MLDHALDSTGEERGVGCYCRDTCKRLQLHDFSLDLRHDGIYRLVKINHFRLMESIEDFFPAVRILESIYNLKRISEKRLTDYDRKQ